MPAAFWTPVAAVRKWLKNPRRNAQAVPAVARSIRKYGFVAPVVVWQSRNRLVAGHTRIAALEQILREQPGFIPRDAPGTGVVPVRFHEFTDEAEANAYALADNKLTEAAEWDEPLLGEVLREIGALDERLLAETGFESEEIARLVREAQAPVETDDDAEEPPAPDATEALRARWGVEPGQLWWIAGRDGVVHRVLVGDCRNADDVARLLAGATIRVAFTSPPYAAQREYDQQSEFRPVPANEYIEWFEPVQACVRRHLAADGSWFVNIKPHCEDGQRVLYVADLLLAHARRWGWRFVDELCWLRAGVPGAWPNRFKNAWEPVFHFSTQAAIRFRPEAVARESAHAFDYSPDNGTSVSGSGLLGKEHASGFHDGLALPSNVVHAGSGGARVTGAHPAEFPVALPRFFVQAYSDAGDAVYDPFAGSGATLLAAEQLGRAGFGMEISPRYVAVILERMSAAVRHELRVRPAAEGGAVAGSPVAPVAGDQEAPRRPDRERRRSLRARDAGRHRESHEGA